MLRNVIQMLSNLPVLLSTLACCVSSVGDVVLQLCHYILHYADIFIDWLLTNLLMYVSAGLICFLYM